LRAADGGGIPPSGYVTGSLLVDAPVGGPDREEEHRHRDPGGLLAVVGEEPDGQDRDPEARPSTPIRLSYWYLRRLCIRRSLLLVRCRSRR
jgi:hypothetical protein